VGCVLAVQKPAAELPWFDEWVALLPLCQEQKLQLLIELLTLPTYLLDMKRLKLHIKEAAIIHYKTIYKLLIRNIKCE
jgi:hypothetical protein